MVLGLKSELNLFLAFLSGRVGEFNLSLSNWLCFYIDSVIIRDNFFFLSLVILCYETNSCIMVDGSSSGKSSNGIDSL